MTERLTADELVALVRRVFDPGPNDRGLAILVDLPDGSVPDSPAWRERREMAAEWYGLLEPRCGEIGFDSIALVLYRNVRANNADLPAQAILHAGGPLPDTADDAAGTVVDFADLFQKHQVFIAPTEFSATAPLKVAARTYGLRAATMPGFSAEMIPALRLDYGDIARRVTCLKKMLDDATRVDIAFEVQGRRCDLVLDLRYRTAHESTGLLRAPGIAGNLPSGEAYIVPYEGERPGEESLTAGELPVQFGDEIVVYRIERNTAISVLTENAASDTESALLAAEPAYGNIAELGLGVLGDFGVRPMGEILLDEKLGLHIAFGRSDHFGGQVGPSRFSAPDRVVHIDRVYIEHLQPLVRVLAVNLTMGEGAAIPLMVDGRYVVCFD